MTDTCYYLYSAHFCFLKGTYEHYMPLCTAAGVKLLNFAQIIQKLHGFMGHSIKKMYSSCSDISSVMLI